MMTNPAHRRLYQERWRRENPGLFRRLQAEWYKKNGKAHYQEHREEHRRQGKLWYSKNKAKENGRKREYYRRGLGLTRSQIMSRIRSVSMMEIAARPIATAAAGCRLIHQPRFLGLDCKPDYGNMSRRVLVFVHGCFFHGCKRHFRPPKTNRRFWVSKVEANKKRDAKVARRLRRLGWRVLTIWEHQV